MAVLVAAVAVAGLSVPAQVRSVRHEVAASRAILVRNGVTFIGGVPPEMPALIAAVRARVPRAAGVRIITPSGVCVPTDHAPGIYYWFAYEILPRVSTCDVHARWWVWLRVRPSQATAVPHGWRTYVFAPDLLLAEMPG